MRKFFNMIAVYLAAVIMLSMVVGCSYAPKPKLPKIATPEVTIDSDGVATWNSVENALYYVYVIDEGDEKLTGECSALLSNYESIKVKAVSGSEKYADSDFSKYKTYIQSTVQQTKLSTPQVTIESDGMATWNSVENAQYYVYVINDGTETTTAQRGVQLSDNQTIKVKACSNDENYEDSDYSQLKTYVNGTVQTKLGTPQVTISTDGVATWNSVENAQYYVYVISGGTETQTVERSVRLADKQSIRVKAGSNDKDYEDSDYSQIKTYVKNSSTISPDVQAYYSVITATSGDELLGQVHDLITTTHTKYTTYDDCKNPTYVVETDKGMAARTVMEFYTQEDISSTWGSGAIGTWNREHVWCQSLSNNLWGTSGGGSDMHHIRPAETDLNGKRGNHKFGNANGGTPAYYKDTDRNNKYVGGWISGDTFEPLDKVKGDVARIVMYVYTHYNNYSNVHGTTNGKGSASFFGKLNYTYVVTASSEAAAIKLLLEWNEADPVDEVEIARNDAVYKIQGNRNPFVDHPEYANAIWG